MTQRVRVLTCSFLLTMAAFAQGDRGTITGAVSDPANAVIPNAKVLAKHIDTGAQYETATTSTGNYTLAQLPAGLYEVSVETSGFNKFVQEGIRVQVAQTARIDIVLQVGGTTQSVTVTADATLLKTENAEQSFNISGDRANALPLNFSAGGGVGGVLRNPFSFLTLTPGGRISGENSIRMNGAPAGQFAVRVEGQEGNVTIAPSLANEIAPSVEALQEMSVQTSNFSAEFGQVAGGLFNFTTKSGTNQYHGSAYEYLVNEAFNAGIPFTNDGEGNLIRPRTRRHDFGSSLGGPVILPKVYNGRNKTFMFLNLEVYFVRERTSTLSTVPTQGMRNGDFSANLTGRTLIAADPLGRPILENTIFDPLTGQTVNGRTVRNPFPGNVIPVSRFDPIAAKIQAMIPNPLTAGVVNNWNNGYVNRRTQADPSVKIDHSFNPQTKMSFYFYRFWSHRFNNGADGLPVPITGSRFNRFWNEQYRLNFHHSVTPTLLLTFGVGDLRYSLPDRAVEGVLQYDAVKELGLVGSAVTPSGFPRITGLSNAFGGLAIGMGPANVNGYFQEKPTAVTSATWIRNNHTYKAGAEFRIETFSDPNQRGSQGNYAFSDLQTGQPATEGLGLGGGVIGHPYASFLLGLVNNASVNAPQQPHMRRNSWSFFGQDTWKVTRKLTLDYGLRWDREEAGTEINHRMSMFSPNVRNPTAGGLLGGIIYEGSGPGRCDCEFTKTYNLGFSPRLGVAYQINSKTVLRAGWGITYGKASYFNYITNSPILGTGWNQLVWTSPTYGDPAVIFRNGLQYNPAKLYEVTLDPGIRPSPGQLDSPSYWFDPNGGRPPRTNQWNISLQRQITTNLMVEAAYVGNRGVWFPSGNLLDLNAITPERLRSFGLDINNAADRTVLTSRLDSPAAAARGFRAPYSGYPLTATVAQSLRPYPQFGAVPIQWAPLGNTWYDSLQVKATKRYSRGLDLTAAFTWQKEQALGVGGAGINDVFNRQNQKSLSSASQPLVFVTGFNYQVPGLGPNKWMRQVIGGWTVGGILRYASGEPIASPVSNNNLASLLFRGTRMNRVPGEPLFTKDLNCGCIDPNKDFVLNPKAWTDAAAGQWGTSAAFYNDYRQPRRPDEQLSFGRVFRVAEGKTFQVRGEFFNVFNRTYLNSPTATNPAATQVRNAQGVPTAGFGRIDPGSVASPPRFGQIVGRFQW